MVTNVVCEICKQEFRSITRSHLLHHGLTLEEYKKRYDVSYATSQGLRQQLSESALGFYRKGGTVAPKSPEGIEHIRASRSGVEMVEKSRRKISLANTGRNLGHPPYGRGRTCPPGCTCGRHAPRSKETHPQLAKSLETRHLLSLSQKGVPKGPSKLRGCTRPDEVVRKIKAHAWFSPNKRELELLGILEDLTLPYAYNGDGRILIILGKAADFVNVNGQKKLIEFNGCRWHCCQLCFGDLPNPVGVSATAVHKRDVGRLKGYKTCGWDPLVIWEHELSNPEAVKQKLLEFERVW